MTREEAIKGLTSLVEVRRKYCDMQTMRDEIEALEIAIKALEHPERNIISVIPCGDTISRQAALDAITDALDNLPPVTPQQKIGRWIEVIDETDSLGNKTWHHECSICGSDKSGWGTYKHCPDCGTKMEVKEK